MAKTTGNAVMDVINVAGGIDNDIGRGLAETALMIPGGRKSLYSARLLTTRFKSLARWESTLKNESLFSYWHPYFIIRPIELPYHNLLIHADSKHFSSWSGCSWSCRHRRYVCGRGAHQSRHFAFQITCLYWWRFLRLFHYLHNE